MDTQIIEGSRLHVESTPEHPCQLGIDVGSTTVKAVVLDGNRILFSDYRRHNADVRANSDTSLKISRIFTRDWSSKLRSPVRAV